MSVDTIAISAEHYLWQSLYTRIYDLQTAHSSLGLTVSSSDIMCVVTIVSAPAAIWPAVGDGRMTAHCPRPRSASRVINGHIPTDQHRAANTQPIAVHVSIQLTFSPRPATLCMEYKYNIEARPTHYH